MLRLLDAPVTADEIDHLGHMNVRHYSKRAWLATQVWFARRGLDETALRRRGLALSPKDLLTHFYREQRLGAPLVVEGAVTEADGAPRLYVEILNTETGERAAAVIVTPQLTERATRMAAAQALPWPAGPELALPAHAAPRSLSFAPPRLDMTLADLERRTAGRAFPYGGVEGVIPLDACDEAGFMRASGAQDIDFVAIDANVGRRGLLFSGEDHVTFGWAMLESRQLLAATPRAGDRVKVIGAEIRIDRKAHWNRRWMFNADSGRIYGVCDHVSLAFDIATRRAIEIPPAARRDLEAMRIPDLAEVG